MVENGPNRKIANSLVALSSAAIVAVYATGYVRTKRAADRFDFEAARRRRVPVHPAVAARDAPAVALATPAPPASPDPTPAALPPRPTPTPRPSPPPIEAPSAVASASPAESIAQTTSAPRETALPKDAVAAPPDEPPDGDVGARPSPLPAVPYTGGQYADSQYMDGTYYGWGSCRHGNLQAEVVIAQGRIMSARISQCLTRYPCSWIERLPGEVVNLQGPPVSFVSGASDSSDAFQYAVMDALSQAR